MIDARTAPYAALLLRVSMGLLFIAHALLKAIVFTMPGTEQYFASLGLPAWFAWAVVIYEFGGGVLLIAGFLTRWVALLLGIHLMVAAVLAHGAGWSVDTEGGGWEFPVLWAMACFAQALLGDGAVSVGSAWAGGRAQGR
jgi:putative oxidoreductase